MLYALQNMYLAQHFCLVFQYKCLNTLETRDLYMLHIFKH